MTLDPGARVGPYQMLSPIGAGGRVEGWRADVRVWLPLANIGPKRIRAYGANEEREPARRFH